MQNWRLFVYRTTSHTAAHAQNNFQDRSVKLMVLTAVKLIRVFSGNVLIIFMVTNISATKTQRIKGVKAMSVDVAVNHVDMENVYHF